MFSYLVWRHPDTQAISSYKYSCDNENGCDYVRLFREIPLTTNLWYDQNLWDLTQMPKLIKYDKIVVIVSYFHFISIDFFLENQ